MWLTANKQILVLDMGVRSAKLKTKIRNPKISASKPGGGKYPCCPPLGMPLILG
jgi:hypothetical protein